MDQKLESLLNEVLEDGIGASEVSINELRQQSHFEFPDSYIDFMKECNGGEGEVGDNSWLCLFPIEDLINTNKNYGLLLDQIPDYFLFGKDAADTGYAFHKLRKTFHSFGLMSNFKTDRIIFCGNTFIEFIEYLYDK